MKWTDRMSFERRVSMLKHIINARAKVVYAFRPIVKCKSTLAKEGEEEGKDT